MAAKRDFTLKKNNEIVVELGLCEDVDQDAWEEQFVSTCRALKLASFYYAIPP
jgi:hypothetical protein